MISKLSVIVPACNSQATIGKCLSALRNSQGVDFELIVVDDASVDMTAEIARKYTDKVLILNKHSGLPAVRKIGSKEACGDVFLYVDSDIVVYPSTLYATCKCFEASPDVDALTGMLSAEHPNVDFFSQYKNLYMHYMFERLPPKINFIYGSIFAVRRASFLSLNFDMGFSGEDLCIGQQLVAQGKSIILCRDLQVVHLKRYSLLSFIKNDFKIPFSWAAIFLRYHGWQQLFKGHTGFAHSSKKQIISIVLIPMFFIFLILNKNLTQHLFLTFLIVWSMLNLEFFVYLAKMRGFLFGFISVIVTFFDHIVMFFGIFSGFIKDGKKYLYKLSRT